MEEIKIIAQIYEIRGKQVMLDSDIANLYNYETKQLNRTVKRNIKRFPEDFCFQLTKDEYEILRCQNGTSSINEHGGQRYLPFVFTEHGITMLAGLLKSDIAIEISIKIVNQFIKLRKFIISNQNILGRITSTEYKLLEHENKLNEIFNILDTTEELTNKIFYEGQIYDSYSLLVEIIEKATNEIVIIDNYIDKTILDLLTKKNINVNVKIIENNRLHLSDLDIIKFNEQYPTLTLIYNKKYHDRFIIVDNVLIYHLGASLKDLGKKCFGINVIKDNYLLDIISNI